MNNKSPRSTRARIAITGSIACGKSLFAKFLNKLGIETLDADDVAHELVSSEERKRLAEIVFKDPEKRKELEARLHPEIKKRLDEWQNAPSEEGKIKIVVIPLLFEVHWEENYDIICAVVCERELQLERMMKRRGYSREQAEARLASQLSAQTKAEKSHYAVWNNASEDELEKSARAFKAWLDKENKIESYRIQKGIQWIIPAISMFSHAAKSLFPMPKASRPANP